MIVKKIRYFIEVQMVRAAAWVTPRLPRWMLLSLGRALGALASWLDARGRATADANLAAVFPDLTRADRRRITRASYQNFARTFIDLFWSSRLTKDNWPRHARVEIDDPDAFAAARQSGAIWVTPHYGNFEMVSQCWGFFGLASTVVAQDFKNPGLTGIFRELRAHSGHTMIPQENAMLRLFKTLKRHGHTAMLTDLNIKPGDAAAVIRCFGLETCVTTAHVLLAQRAAVPVFPTVCEPLADGTYRILSHGPLWIRADERPADAAQRVWDVFEAHIRARPEWWMWMYKHWRYLPGQEGDRAYPPYANASGAFRRLPRSSSAAENKQA